MKKVLFLLCFFSLFVFASAATRNAACTAPSPDEDYKCYYAGTPSCDSSSDKCVIVTSFWLSDATGNQKTSFDLTDGAIYLNFVLKNIGKFSSEGFRVYTKNPNIDSGKGANYLNGVYTQKVLSNGVEELLLDPGEEVQYSLETLTIKPTIMPGKYQVGLNVAPTGNSVVHWAGINITINRADPTNFEAAIVSDGTSNWPIITNATRVGSLWELNDISSFTQQVSVRNLSPKQLNGTIEFNLANTASGKITCNGKTGTITAPITVPANSTVVYILTNCSASTGNLLQSGTRIIGANGTDILYISWPTVYKTSNVGVVEKNVYSDKAIVLQGQTAKLTIEYTPITGTIIPGGSKIQATLTDKDNGNIVCNSTTTIQADIPSGTNTISNIDCLNNSGKDLYWFSVKMVVQDSAGNQYSTFGVTTQVYDTIGEINLKVGTCPFTKVSETRWKYFCNVSGETGLKKRVILSLGSAVLKALKIDTVTANSIFFGTRGPYVYTSFSDKAFEIETEGSAATGGDSANAIEIVFVMLATAITITAIVATKKE